MRHALLLPLLLAAPALVAQQPDVDGLIAKHLQALGGVQKLKAINTKRTVIKTTTPQGEMKMVMEQKRPMKMRMDMEVQGMTITQAFDGKQGWFLGPMTGGKPQVLPAEQAKGLEQQADMDSSLIDYKARGTKVALLGKDTVDGSEVYKLQVTSKDGDASTLFLDADSYLLVRIQTKMKAQGQEVEQETVLGDYREVGGTMEPHSLEVNVKGAGSQKLTMEKVEVNVAVDDARFVAPKAEAPAAAKAEAKSEAKADPKPKK